MRRDGGYTLVELMVAAAVMGIITTLLLGSMSAQRRNYAVTDQVVEIQQSLRVIGDVVERDIRHAGLMVPEGGAVCVIDNVNAPDSLFMSDDAAINPLFEKESGLGARIQGGANNIVNGSQLLNVDDVVIEITVKDPAYDTDANGVSDSDFRINSGVIVVDAANPARGVACGVVEDVPSGTQLRIDILTPPLAAFVGGMDTPDLAVVPARAYQVNGNMQLVRDGAVVANGVEDLQVALFVDDNDDNILDPGEYRGDGVGPDFANAGIDMGLLRELRVNLVLRTRDPEIDRADGMPQATENRVVAPIGDGFRRRVLTSTVMLRNVGGRPV